MEALAEQAGAPVRTIRFYIAEGLLPGPGGRGKATLYGEEHALRLRLIRQLVAQRVPLAEIREQVSRLSLEEVRALLVERGRAEQLLRAARAVSPRDYVATLLSTAQAARHQAPAEPARAQSALAPEAALPRLAHPGTWRRWELAPGVELHVRADLAERHGGAIERLLHTAAKLFSRMGF